MTRASELRIEGGTHNPMAPPFDFRERAYLPALARMGLRLSVRLEGHGFEVGGGGRFTLEVAPAERLERLELLADHLLVPIALGSGGAFRTSPLTLHARTNMEVVRAFCVADFRVVEGEGRAMVEVLPG